MTATTLGSRTTAEEALRDVSLAGRRALVTGASSGLGIETSRVLAKAGADVIMACRNTKAGEDVAAQLRAALAAGAGTLEVRALDLADLRSVRAFAEAEARSGLPLHLLVNNAGVMATPLGTTAQGMEQQLGTNHLGHFLLTQLLLASLEASDSARVVSVSSALHTRGRGARMLETLDADPRYERRKYVPFDAYGDSKLANILFTRELAKRVTPSVKAYSLHPGVIPTNLSRSLGIGGALYRFFGKLFLKSIPQGSATSIYAATAPELESRSGTYLADCAEVTPSADARDDELAQRLWTSTEQRVATA